jgi:cystathionine beta-synthase
MILDAEKSGRIKKGDTLIEATSGNTGIGMALAGAALGYHVVITMPEKMSKEKQVVIESLGAEIIRTPTEAAWDDPQSHIEVAKRIQKERVNAHILDQYGNESNPLAHFEGTGKEIVADMEGQSIDMLVIGVGTGGTLTGIAKMVKQTHPDVIVVGVDPEGSILAGPEPIKNYHVEGIGYDFFPDVFEPDLVDRWVKCNDKESFILARRLMKEEGLLVGGSSGSAMMGALTQANQLKAGQNCVVLLPDGIRNYLTKFVDADWRETFGF